MEQLTPYIPVALGALVAVLFYALDKSAFQKIALSAFLAVEKELDTEEGREKMAVAVLRIIDTLPAQLKGILNIIAFAMKTDLHGLVHQLAQKTYDLIFVPLRNAAGGQSG